MAGGSKRFMINAYYTNSAQNRPDGWNFFPEDTDVNLCTHVTFAFAEVENGKLAPKTLNDEVMYARFNGLKIQKPGLKTLLAVGGWFHAAEPFSKMVKTAQSREVFIDHSISYLRERKFDGLGVDWEFPADEGGPPEDKDNFTLLLQELQLAFTEESYRTGQEKLLLAAAVPAGKIRIDQGYDVPNVSKAVDFLNLMAYDLHGGWEKKTGLNSPLYPLPNERGDEETFNQDWAVRYWIEKGAPPEKLLLGLGFYGASFTLTNTNEHDIGAGATGPGQPGQHTRADGMLTYYEVCEKLQSGWTRVYQDEQKGCYAFQDNQWVGYDDVQSIQAKAQYIKEKGLGGAMAWTLDLDDFRGEFSGGRSYPLLSKVASVLDVNR